ncbi:MAG TPA: hypothetical protein VN969_33755 [Streptosporangiaceae bacterium]|nr:hypothetical protein [Streptosporangiaceae bacterium]
MMALPLRASVLFDVSQRARQRVPTSSAVVHVTVGFVLGAAR